MAENKTPELDFFTGKPLDGNTPLSQEQAKPETDFFTGTAFNSVPQSSATRQQLLKEGLLLQKIFLQALILTLFLKVILLDDSLKMVYL